MRGGEDGLSALQMGAYGVVAEEVSSARRSAIGTFRLPPTLIPRSSAAYFVVIRTP